MPAIQFENVCFSYGSGEADPQPSETGNGSQGEGAPEGAGRSQTTERAVLRNASFVVEEGEFVALVGTNGSGKSTIAALVDAFLAPDAGRVTVLEHDIADIAGTDEVFALRREVGFVFQNPDDQIASQIVVDEVAFGPCNLGLPREEVVRRVDAALAAVDMTGAVGHDVNTLSGGQRQRIAIADALAMQPRLLVLDEPTSMLDPHGRQAVMDIMQRLHEEGMTILLVTHDPDEAALADRVLRVVHGAVREWSSGSEGASANRGLRIEGTGASETKGASNGSAPCKDTGIRSHVRPAQASAAADSPAPASERPVPIIRFEDVCFRYDGSNELALGILGSTSSNQPVLDGINLEVLNGELLAIAGPNGSGKTTLIQHMNGLLRPTSGRVTVNGIDTSSRSGSNAARQAVGVSFQYPERSLFAQTAYDDIAFGPRNLGLPPEEVEARVHQAAEDVALDLERFAQRNPFDLSGGEQRKVALAGVIALQPQVLVLDEPCASMDAPTHDHFLELFLRMKDRGRTIVIVSHSERDIEILADRTFRMA